MIRLLALALLPASSPALAQVFPFSAASDPVDGELGLVAWERTMSKGCGYGPVTRALLSAEVGGVVFPAPEAP